MTERKTHVWNISPSSPSPRHENTTMAEVESDQIVLDDADGMDGHDQDEVILTERDRTALLLEEDQEAAGGDRVDNDGGHIVGDDLEEHKDESRKAEEAGANGGSEEDERSVLAEVDTIDLNLEEQDRLDFEYEDEEEGGEGQVGAANRSPVAAAAAATPSRSAPPPSPRPRPISRPCRGRFALPRVIDRQIPSAVGVSSPLYRPPLQSMTQSAGTMTAAVGKDLRHTLEARKRRHGDCTTDRGFAMNRRGRFGSLYRGQHSLRSCGVLVRERATPVHVDPFASPRKPFKDFQRLDGSTEDGSDDEIQVIDLVDDEQGGEDGRNRADGEGKENVVEEDEIEILEAKVTPKVEGEAMHVEEQAVASEAPAKEPVVTAQSRSATGLPTLGEAYDLDLQIKEEAYKYDLVKSDEVQFIEHRFLDTDGNVVVSGQPDVVAVSAREGEENCSQEKTAAVVQPVIKQEITELAHDINLIDLEGEPMWSEEQEVEIIDVPDDDDDDDEVEEVEVKDVKPFEQLDYKPSPDLTGQRLSDRFERQSIERREELAKAPPQFPVFLFRGHINKARFQKAIERQRELQRLNPWDGEEGAVGKSKKPRNDEDAMTEVAFYNLPTSWTLHKLESMCLAHGPLRRAGLDPGRRFGVVVFESREDAQGCAWSFDLRKEAGGELIRARLRCARKREG